MLTAMVTLAAGRDGEKNAASVAEKAFSQANQGSWKEVFTDTGTADWKEKWFLDGEIGKVSTNSEGMTLSAGPEFKNDSHHMVLWTKQNFVGDLKIEYDFTRLDKENRCVNILYIQATGSGKEEYHKDIAEWTHLRRIPSMRTYYANMNVYHVSYAAFGESNNTNNSYIRGRRYLPDHGKLEGTELKPDYFSESLFATGVKHHMTFIKKDRADSSGQFTRSGRYGNFRISTPHSRSDVKEHS